MNINGSTSPPNETPDTSMHAEPAMHGQSATKSPELPEHKKNIPVIERFGPVIQGEGAQAGLQTLFIRFGGCDYRCVQCDSMHAVEPLAVQANRTMMSAIEILEWAMERYSTTGVRWITFTGGNPCMHKLDVLVQILVYQGFYINVETQGTLAPDWLRNVQVVTVSPKTHGMGERFDEEVYARFCKKVFEAGKPLCVKAVVFNTVDLEFALQIEEVTRIAFSEVSRLAKPLEPMFYLSLGNPLPPKLNMETFQLEDRSNVNLPAYLLNQYRELSEEVLADPRLKNFRFLPQIHVLMYGNESER